MPGRRDPEEDLRAVADAVAPSLAALPPLPSRFSESRATLHALAFYVMAPARRMRTGRIGLQWIPGGFGTPFFDGGTQIRVDGTDLVVHVDNDVRSTPITTLAAAGDLVGVTPNPGEKGGFDVDDMPDANALLPVTTEAVAFLDAWLALATSTLEQLRSEHPALDPTPAQLWPEHFDLAIVLGDKALRRRATFGFSPGDAAHDQPYAYVSVGDDTDIDTDTDGYWNDRAFRGASRHLDELAATGRPREEALRFLREGVATLSRLPS